MYTIALYGTNSFIKPDADSMNTFVELGTADPMSDENWLKIEVVGVKPHWESYSDIEEGNGGVGIQPKTLVRTFEIETAPFLFPEEMEIEQNIAFVLNKRRVFLYKGTFPESLTWELHPDGKAMCVVLKKTTEDDFANGCKSVTLNGRLYRLKR